MKMERQRDKVLQDDGMNVTQRDMDTCLSKAQNGVSTDDRIIYTLLFQ